MLIVSGSKLLATPAVGTGAEVLDAAFQVVAKFESNEKPRQGGTSMARSVPIQACIGIQQQSNVLPGPLQLLQATTTFDLPAGQSVALGEFDGNMSGTVGCGVLRWRVTRGSVESIWYTDMRPGLFHLGLCDKVEVAALRWRTANDNGQAVGALLVSCALSDGDGNANYDEFTYTIEAVFDEGTELNLNGGFPIFRPARARWFTPYVAACDTGTTIFGSTDVIRFNAGQVVDAVDVQPAEQVVFDGPNNAIIPTKHRYEIAGSNAALNVYCDAALSQKYVIGIRYYLAH
jgi:hypothetical protein